MIPVLDHETRRLCIKVKGACGKIEVPSSGLSFVLTRVGGSGQIIAAAEPMQFDGRICMTLDKLSYVKAKPGRYVARLVGALNCNLCVPIQIGARCGLAEVTTESVDDCTDCDQEVSMNSIAERQLASRTPLRR